MPERAQKRTWAPRLALMAAVALLAIDLPSRDASAEAEANKPGQPSKGAGDIKDTHQRLERIYARLGIRREVPKQRPKSRGCDCDSKPRGGKLRPAPKVSAPPMLPPILGYVLIGVVLLAMLLPIILALRGRDDQIAVAVAEEQEQEQETSAPPREAWEVSFAECRRLLLAGRLAEAFASLHRLTLLSLQAAEALELDATSTNWDYVRRLVGRPAERALLSEVTIAAESAVLGKHPPDAARFDHLEQLLRQHGGGH